MTKHRALTILGLAAFSSLAVLGLSQDKVLEAAPEPNWQDILGKAQGSLPAPQSSVFWRKDLKAAFAEAKKKNRPLFVTLRCLPCKQCADFDKDVLEGGPALDPLLKQYVTVRVTSMSEVDKRLFRFDEFQDLDLSWWGYLFSPEGRIYAVYGGKDHVSDSTRISVPSLAKTLQRVLAHHYDPRRKDWSIDGPKPKLSGAPKTPSKLKGFKKWYKNSHPEVHKQTCLHCHQVAEVLRQPRFDKKKFNKKTDFYVWPYPENVGITLNRDHGLKVTKVQPGSPAAKAGVKAGDILAAADGRKLFGQTDFRGVLHRAGWDSAKVELKWWSGSSLKSATLSMSKGWRKYELGWRKSVAEARIGAHPGLPWPLKVNNGERKRYGIGQNTLAVKPWFGKNAKNTLAYQHGLRGGDIIIAVNGKKPNLHGRSFNLWFRMNFDPGDKVTYTVINRNKKTREIRFRLPKNRH